MTAQAARSERAQLDALFQQAEYRIFAEPHTPLLTRIGCPEPALAALLADCRVASAVLISAYNPEGRPIAAALNADRHERLQALAAQHGWRWLPAEGASPSRDWVEPALLIFGIDSTATRALAEQFAQAAWLEYAADGSSRLCWRGVEATDVAAATATTAGATGPGTTAPAEAER